MTHFTTIANIVICKQIKGHILKMNITITAYKTAIFRNYHPEITTKWADSQVGLRSQQIHWAITGPVFFCVMVYRGLPTDTIQHGSRQSIEITRTCIIPTLLGHNKAPFLGVALCLFRNTLVVFGKEGFFGGSKIICLT